MVDRRREVLPQTLEVLPHSLEILPQTLEVLPFRGRPAHVVRQRVGLPDGGESRRNRRRRLRPSLSLPCRCRLTAADCLVDVDGCRYRRKVVAAGRRDAAGRVVAAVDVAAGTGEDRVGLRALLLLKGRQQLVPAGVVAG